MSKSKRKVPVPGAGAWGSPLDENFQWSTPYPTTLTEGVPGELDGLLVLSPAPSMHAGNVLVGKAVENHFFVVPSPLEELAETQHVCVCDV